MDYVYKLTTHSESLDFRVSLNVCCYRGCGKCTTWNCTTCIVGVTCYDIVMEVYLVGF